MRGLGFSLGTFFKITLIAIVGILFAKWLLSKVNVPGLSAAVQAV
jgi:hypothetical protein